MPAFPHTGCKSVAFLLVAAALAACNDIQSIPSAVLASAAKAEALSTGRTTEFPSVRRVDVSVTASGAFRPGTPIVVHAHARARRDASNVSYSILLLDGDSAAPADTLKQGEELSNWHGSLLRGASQDLLATVSFPNPGYYRVLVIAKTNTPTGVNGTSRDTTILNETYETLWIAVAENGGRLTNGYDSTAFDHSRFLALYGSYGPLSPKKRAEAPDSSRLPAARPVASRTSSQLSGPAVSGYFRYTNYEAPGTPKPLLPVGNAEVEVSCFGKSDPRSEIYDLFYMQISYTTSTGFFGVGCDPGYEYIEGTLRLRNSYVYAAGFANATAGAGFAGYGGESFELKAANDYAARVFVDLTEGIPVMFSKLGRTRARVYVEVSDTDQHFGIFYCATGVEAGCRGADMIQTNYTRVFGEDGLFVSTHEYAHAFHYYAIEPWATYVCTDNAHGFTETENLSCAFVEGFADFASMWVGGSRLTTNPYGGDYGLEHNTTIGQSTNPPADGDGVRVEAAVAAFLYDLVDGANEPDSFANTADGDESFDAAAYAGTWISDVIQYCTVGADSRLDGADQLVYCMENTTDARPESERWSTAWRVPGAITWSGPVTQQNQAVIRKLWKYNFYGVLE